MEILPSFTDRFEAKVCWLKKSLYGLKQSPGVQFDRFTEAVVRFGSRESQVNYIVIVHLQYN